MAEIHEEMSELLDKQVNVQKENLKKSSGIHANPQKKVCDENEEEKNDDRVKKIFVEGRIL